MIKRIKCFSKDIKRVHFIGIGGVSMSSLAKYLVKVGYTVSGSDKTENEFTNELKDLGVDFQRGHQVDLIKKADAVVYTSAISETNPEYVYAKNLLLIKRSELLGAILNKFDKSVCISGSHGKTTTTAMIAHILKCANVHPTVFLGGDDKSFGNFIFGKKNIAVAETCEFRKNFLDIRPNLSVVLNIDDDHKDSFSSIDDEINAFNTFIRDSVAVINADDKNTEKLTNGLHITYGIKNKAIYSAKNVIESADGLSFSVYKYDKRICRVKIFLKGEYNVYNVLASFTVSDVLGIDKQYILEGLKSFNGVKRRAETIGEISGKKVISDYAHHPSEIKAITNALKLNDNAVVVFQPHTFSRTKFLMEEFVSALSPLKNLVIYKTYPAREKYDKTGSAKTLTERVNFSGGNAVYCSSKNKLLTLIKDRINDVNKIVFIGAGDIYDISKKIVEKNRQTAFNRLPKFK